QTSFPVRACSDPSWVQGARKGRQSVVLLAERERYPDVEEEHLDDGDPDAQPIGTQADGRDGNTPWRFADGAVAGVQIEVDPVPKPGEVVSHVQGDDRLIGLQQVLLDEQVGLYGATRHHVLSF